MPELPEVETTKRGISPHIENRRVKEIIVRQKKLRWEVPNNLNRDLVGKIIFTVKRRGKYLLLASDNGTLIIHLGMSGRLRIVNKDLIAAKHDHVDVVLENGKALRFTDPRRFGCVLWEASDIDSHPHLKNLGTEPLQDELESEY